MSEANRLDIPREKIAYWFAEHEFGDDFAELPKERQDICLEYAHEILSPLIEDAKAQTRDEWRIKCADLVAARHEISTREAKKQEREKIRRQVIGAISLLFIRKYSATMKALTKLNEALSKEE